VQASTQTGRALDTTPAGTERDPSRLGTLKRTLREFQEDNLTDWAGALTYYGLLALFPAMIALVSLIGLFGDPRETTRTVTEIVTGLGPESAAETFRGPIESITSNRGTAGLLFVLGLAVAVWSASGYIGAFGRASNVIWETPEGRPFWKLRPLQIAVTLTMVLLLAIVLLGITLTGPVVDAVAEPLGIGSTAVTIWDIAKWPLLLVLALTMISVLYYAAPNVRLRGFKWITPGAVLAVVVWLLASALFALYVSMFGSYDKTYGTLGGVVVLLVWMWIGNIALLLGAELNSEIERSREFEEGVPAAEREIQLEPRSAPDPPRTA
jgi:membrane protein